MGTVVALGGVAMTDVAISLEVLPAFHGDALLLECHRPGNVPWRALIDGGPSACAARVRDRLALLPADDRRLDLLIVSHIDADHIAGLLPLVTAPPADLTVGEVWFNAEAQLPAQDGARRSVAQGMAFAAEMSASGAVGVAWPWNESFGRAAVMTSDDAGSFVELPSIDGAPRITVLSPTPKRLRALGRVWLKEKERLNRGASSDEPPPLVPWPPLDDLAVLASTKTSNDQAVPNGSSIALLIEHRGASIILAADAWPNVLGAALFGLAEARGRTDFPVDLFKLPHHASQGNVTDTLLRLAPAKHYVVSTNGDVFDHPDDVALARVVTNAPTGSTLWFNHATAKTLRWGEARLQDRYNYTAQYPSGPGAALRIELDARPLP
jgi:beta-lactamase superfamily II metal-dependent hydrolase